MAKRFTDTDKWSHAWFCDLTLAQKLLWLFICDRCDSVGVWNLNMRLASFSIGVDVSISDLEAIGVGTRLIMVGEDKVWLPGFIKFQYKNLNPKNNAHRGMMKSILGLVGNLPLTGESADLLLTFGRLLNDPQPTLDRGSTDPTGNGKGNGKGKEKSRTENSDEFETCYAKYPRKEGKSGGLKIYAKLTEEDRTLVAAAVENYARRKAGTEIKYLKLFSSFMAEWRDWLDPVTGGVAAPAPQFKSIAQLKAEGAFNA